MSSSEAREWIGKDALGEPTVNVRCVTLEVVLQRHRSATKSPPGITFSPMATWTPSARKYVESRGITSEQVERWGIGHGFAGRFAGRIVFPKRSPSGELLGWSARTFIGDRKRYLEATAQEAPNASAAIFGEQHWPTKERRRLFLTEGAINALAVERVVKPANGWPEDVGRGIGAISGANLHTIQAVKLGTWEEVVVVSDPDAAGDRLAEEVAGLFGRSRTKMLRARLPDGVDAADASPKLLAEVIGL